MAKSIIFAMQKLTGNINHKIDIGLKQKSLDISSYFTTRNKDNN